MIVRWLSLRVTFLFQFSGLIVLSMIYKDFMFVEILLKQFFSPFNVQCQTLNEEEIFEVQDKHSLFQLGWIHVSDRIAFLMTSFYTFGFFFFSYFVF